MYNYMSINLTIWVNLGEIIKCPNQCKRYKYEQIDNCSRHSDVIKKSFSSSTSRPRAYYR